MELNQQEDRLSRVIQTSGFRNFRERLDEVLDKPVWWYCSTPDDAIHLIQSHDKRECGLIHDDPAIRKIWLDGTYMGIKQVQETQVALITASPPEHVQIIIPVLCGSTIQGYVGLAHLLPHDQKRLSPFLTLMLEHIRQIAEKERAVADLFSIQSLWQEVVSTMDFNELQQKIVTEILSLLDTREGVLLLANQKKILQPRYSIGFELDNHQLEEFQIPSAPYENKMHSWTQNAHILSVGDPLRQWYLSLSRYQDQNMDVWLASRWGGDSELRWLSRFQDQNVAVWAVPLAVENRLYGLLLCIRADDEELSSQLDLALGTLVLGSSVAIRNALEMEAMRQKAQALTTVHSIYRLMSSVQSITDLLNRLGHLITQLLNVKKCSIMLLENANVLIPKVTIGLQPGEIGTSPLPVGVGISGRVAQTSLSMNCKNPRKDKNFSNDPESYYPSPAYLSVPLVENELLGVITVAEKNSPPNTFTEGDLEILNTMSEQAVLAMLNIQIYEKQEKIALRTMGVVDNFFETGDPDKEGHAQKLARWVDEFAAFMQHQADERKILQMAALIHDVGFWQVMKGTATSENLERHTDVAIRMARRLDLPEKIIPILRDHHEHFDGSGSPRKLREGEIPLGARILALIDSFIKLVYPTDNTPPLTVEEALVELGKESGKRFDPHLYESLVRFIRTKDLHLI